LPFQLASHGLLAAVLVVNHLPVMLLLLQHGTDAAIHGAKAPIRGDGNGQHWTRLQMFRHGLFWLNDPLGHRACRVGTAVILQQVHLTEVAGLDAGQLLSR